MPGMSFPAHHFPTPITPHGAKRLRFAERQRFAEFGSFGGVSLEEDGSDVKFTAQKLHVQPGELRYAAYHPALPLLQTPATATFPFKDRISGKRLERKKNIKSFIRTIIQHRKDIKRARGAWDVEPVSAEKRKNGEIIREIKSALETAIAKDDVEGQLIAQEKIKDIAWCKPTIEEYKQIGDLSYLQSSVWAYTGGCVVSLPIETSPLHVIVHASGIEWNEISLTSLTESGHGLCTGQRVSSLQIDSPIFQVDGQVLNNQACCVVRMKDSCSLYKLTDSSPQTFHHLGNQLIDSPSSVAFSPYLPGECVIATLTGDVLLWNPDRSMELVVEGSCPRFEVSEPWRQCQFGAHPRLLTMADRSVVQIYDIRTKTCNSSTDLFSLPNKILHTGERIQVTQHHPHNTFYHQVATDYTLLLMDERFPGQPVLQWSHMLEVPSYLSVVDYQLDGEEDILLLASQTPAEAFVFQYKIGSGDLPPQSVCVPWRVSRIDDFALFPELSGTVNSMVRNERFTSLAGVCLINSPSNRQRFVAVQLDCHGDLFYQTYDKRVSGEITQSPGPGSVHIKLSDCVVKRGREWLKGLEAQSDRWFLETPSRDSDQIVNASGPFIAVSDQTYAHVLCPLCMPQTCGDNSDDLKDRGPPETDVKASDDNDTCWVCGISLGVTRSLVHANQQDRVIQVSFITWDWDYVFPQSTKLLDCPLPISKLLTKDWFGETDIKELLDAHDKQITERNEAIIKERKEAKRLAQSKSSTQTLLADLLAKVKGSPSEKPKRTGLQSPSTSQSSTPSTPVRTPPGTPVRTPTGPFSGPPTPTLPGFGATPLRLTSKSQERSPSISNSPSSRDKVDKEVSDFFSFTSPSPRTLSKQQSTPPSKRRKKHVTGF